LPIDLFVLIEHGAGIPLPIWILSCRIPFHLLMMGWAWFHLRNGKEKERQKS
jgi:uncharacterized membrane protein